MSNSISDFAWQRFALCYDSAGHIVGPCAFGAAQAIEFCPFKQISVDATLFVRWGQSDSFEITAHLKNTEFKLLKASGHKNIQWLKWPKTIAQYWSARRMPSAVSSISHNGIQTESSFLKKRNGGGRSYDDKSSSTRSSSISKIFVSTPLLVCPRQR